MIPSFDIRAMRSRLKTVSPGVRLERLRAIATSLSETSLISPVLQDIITIDVPVEFRFHDGKDFEDENAFPEGLTIGDFNVTLLEHMINRDQWSEDRRGPNGEIFKILAGIPYVNEDDHDSNDEINAYDGVEFTIPIRFKVSDLHQCKRGELAALLSNMPRFWDKEGMLTYIFGYPSSSGARTTSEWDITDYAEVYVDYADSYEDPDKKHYLDYYQEIVTNALKGIKQ